MTAQAIVDKKLSNEKCLHRDKISLLALEEETDS